MTRVLSFRNRQQVRTLALPAIRRIARHILESELSVTEYELGFHFVEPEEMARLNEHFLQHTGSTDVITFDHSTPGAPVSEPGCLETLRQRAGSEIGAPRLHGEIFISTPDAVQQAREFGTTWQSEVVRYIIHGLLHLRGHDDLQSAARKVMKREENRLLKLVVAKFPIASLARGRGSPMPNRR